MATAPKFNTPKTSPPPSGWQPGHRPPAMGYGQLDGNADGDDKAATPAAKRPEGY